MNELQNRGVIEEIDAILRHRNPAFALADQHHPMRSESVTEFFHREIAERFPPATCERVKQNEWIISGEVRNRISGRQLESQRAGDGNLERFNEFEIALNRVRPTINRRRFLVEKTSTFAGIA